MVDVARPSGVADPGTPDRRELVREALRTIDELKARLEIAQSGRAAPIAIVGIGCRYPGGITDPRSFWQLLAAGVDAIAEVPADRWRASEWFDPDSSAPGKMSSRWGGFLDRIDLFDAQFFGIAAREATMLDPQHRILLEVAVEALENAGRSTDAVAGTRTGVFVGMTTTEYHDHLMRNLPVGALSPYLATGNVLNAAAGRIAYVLGAHGPSVAVDTACSSSLTAVHLACQSLRAGDCDTAMAGGVNVILAPQTGVMFSKWGMMAADGRCKTFDAAADGFVRSEGCAMIVLKRLDDALAEGDRVLAVIEGSAVNQDGRSSGLTVPNGAAQEALIRQALAGAGLSPGEIDYVEAHGTGTAMGDPIELDALGAVFGPGRDTGPKLRIGSIKTNLGHTEAASGIAGLIKCVLALEHEQIPAHLHFRQPTPEVWWDRLPLEVTAGSSPWPRTARRRRAGVSSFGFSGANSHVIIAEPPLPDLEPAEPDRSRHILTLSAKDPKALTALAQRYASRLREPAAAAPGDICFTANTGRSHFNHRLFVCGETTLDLADKLGAVADTPLPDVAGYGQAFGDSPKVAFLFTGQGSQYTGMGRQLFESEPVFRDELRRCAKYLAPHLDRPLLELLFSDSGEALDQTRYTQPALFALEWAMAQLWRSFGITPAATLGHSLGEYVAACQAGVMPLEEGLRLVAGRARLMNAMPQGGAMAAVSADPQTVERLLAPFAGSIAIAAVNGPQSVTIAGHSVAIARVMATLAADGISALRLNVSHAFHSPLMDPMLDAFENLASSVTFARPTIPVISNLTGRAAEGQDLIGPNYWRRHLREPVRFADGVAALRRRGCTAFVEVGPTPILIAMARRLVEEPALWLPSLARDRDDWSTLLQSLGELFVAGGSVNWAGLDRGRRRKRCDLPTYPFQRKRYWVDGTSSPIARAVPHAVTDEGVFTPAPVSPLVKDRVFSGAISRRSHSWLADHVVGGAVVVPMTAYLTWVLDAARHVAGSSAVALNDVVLAERAVLHGDAILPMQIVISPATPVGRWTFKVISLTAERVDGFVLHVGGGVVATDASSAISTPINPSADMATLGPDRHLETMQAGGLTFGPAFRGVERVRCRPGAAIGDIEGQDIEAPGGAFSPGLLDACLQPLLHAWPEHALSGGFLPFSIERVEILHPPASVMQSHCRARTRQSNGGTMTGDVTIYEASGRALAVVEGLTVRALSGSSRPDEVDRLLYQNVWRPVPGNALLASSAPNDLGLPEAAASAIRNQPTRIGAAAEQGYEAASRALNQRALGLIVQALVSLGWTTAAGERVSAAALVGQLGVHPRYQELLNRFLEIIGEAGFCDRGSEGWIMRRPLTAAPVVTDPRKTFTPEGRLLEHCGAKLVQILKGIINPLEVLFGSEAQADLETIYATSLTSMDINGMAADVVAGAVARLPAAQSVSILEIGAGTGGLTTHLLEQLPASQVQYCFTDISPALISRARARLAGASGLTFEVLDIERDGVAQGFAGRRFDIVLAANVLHATSDLASALSRVRDLLQPGGLLVLIEGTRRLAWIDVTFGLTDGWWKFVDRNLRPDYPLLSTSSWLALLERSGFSSTIKLDGPATNGGPSDYTVFASNAGPRPASGPDQAASVLLFAADTAQAEAVCRELRARGRAVVIIEPDLGYQAVTVDRFTIRPHDRADYDRLFADLEMSGWTCGGIVHIGSAPLSSDEVGMPDLGTQSLLHLSQSLGASGTAPPDGLWVITRGAQAVDPDVARLDPNQATAWGFAKTLGLEHPELRVRRLDLDPSNASIDREAAAIVDILLDPTRGAECALRGGLRYEPQLERWTDADAQPMRLVAAVSGHLNSLAWQPTERRAPGPKEVEIKVEAVGLNFRDVLSVLDMYAGPTGELGGEVAGTVVAVGRDVHDRAVGDAVGAIAFGGFSSFVTTAAALTLAKPVDWSFADIVTAPAAFATAYHALVQLAQVRRGERVLIHTASGSVGLATVQLAQWLGCEIIATAGSEEKRRYLRSRGVDHVFDSRSVSFASSINAITPQNGSGVDVIVNTLAAEFTDASLSVLDPHGRFIELGRRDLHDASRASALRPLARYVTVDLATLARQSPDTVGVMLESASRAIAEGSFSAPPTSLFPAERTQEAFRLVSQARHIGKVVVVPPRRASADGAARFLARADHAYLVTGGLGGLGLATAQWLAERGARHLVLLGRRAPGKAAQAAIDELKATGVFVMVAEGDVADRHTVMRLFGTMGKAMPPLAGIVHSAGVLDDGAIVQQTWSRMEQVFAPKLAGAWHLHDASRHQPLDLFILYSSASAVFGSPGQANHAAANAALDALAHHRRALGLAGLSINWGAWSEVGAAARPDVVDQVATFGVEAITPREGFAALERLILSDVAQATVARVAWDRFLSAQRPAGEQAPFLGLGAPPAADVLPQPEDLRSSPIPLDLEVMTAADRRRSVAQLITASLVGIVGLEPDATLDPHQPLRDLGLDSLMSVELRNWLQSSLRRKLPATLAFDFPTFSALVDHICDGFAGSEEARSPELDPTSGVANDLAGLMQMSAEQSEALLIEELARTRELLP